VVALLADCHALIYDFPVVSREKLARAFVDGSSRFAFGRAAGRDEGQGCQSSEPSHLTSRLIIAGCCTCAQILASP
jgi:hypothetical protein